MRNPIIVAVLLMVSTGSISGCKDGAAAAAGGLLVVEALRSGFDRPKALQSGRNFIPEARQIEELLGPATHRLVNQKSRHRDGLELEWQTDVYFGGRYELVMALPVIVHQKTSTVVRSLGEPTFQFREVLSATRPPGENLEIRYRGDRQRKLTKADWVKIVAAQGDFSVIGIELSTAPPIEGFAQLTLENN